MDVMGEGLQFPEGPIAMPDGSVILVEIARGTLSRVQPNGTIEVVAECGGGPNGAAYDTPKSEVLVLSYTRHWLGERSPLGRAAALLAGCPPPTTSTMDLQCGADRHPSSPFALSGSSVGQRGIFGL